MNKKEIEIIIKGAITQECLSFLKSESQNKGFVRRNIDETIVEGLPIKECLNIYKNYLASQKLSNNLDKYIKRIEPIKLWEKNDVPKTVDEYIDYLIVLIDNIERKLDYISSALDEICKLKSEE